MRVSRHWASTEFYFRLLPISQPTEVMINDAFRFFVESTLRFDSRFVAFSPVVDEMDFERWRRWSTLVRNADSCVL